MLVEAVIRFGDQRLIEALLVYARLVACRQKDCLPLGIESKGDPPYTINFLA